MLWKRRLAPQPFEVTEHGSDAALELVFMQGVSGLLPGRCCWCPAHLRLIRSTSRSCCPKAFRLSPCSKCRTPVLAGRPDSFGHSIGSQLHPEMHHSFRASSCSNGRPSQNDGSGCSSCRRSRFRSTYYQPAGAFTLLPVPVEAGAVSVCAIAGAAASMATVQIAWSNRAFAIVRVLPKSGRKRARSTLPPR